MRSNSKQFNGDPSLIPSKLLPSNSKRYSKTSVVSPVRHQIVTLDNVTPLVSLPHAATIHPLSSRRSTGYFRHRGSHDSQSISSITSEEVEPNTPTFLFGHDELSSSLPKDSVFDHDVWVYEYGAEKERDRQTRQHYVLKQVLQGNIHVTLDKPTRILDSACGVGLWSLEMAHDFPNCQVIGIDILPPSEHEGWSLARTGAWSAGQTRNVCFQKQDILQSTLSFDDGSFDFIYQRDVATVLPFNIWPKLLLEFFRITKPGGKIELVEYDLHFKNPGPVLNLVNEWYSAAAATIGVRQDYTNYLSEYLERAGYINITEKAIDIPIGEWSTDDLQRQYGFLYKEQMKALFKSMKRWWCTEIKVSPQEYDQVCIDALKEFEEYHSMARWKIFTAEKPKSA
ncbi:S-adenosyl-L-methionine-dependent methyltransferase [Rhizopus microsporus]|uniref:S-adenosyl-L-methionine-dependent methyltransferase n=1 Tax=Rhizopus microsporus TaxID=58291 RepID=A0A1X0RXX8_RHIZD|nr:S-adenosyl-L-methionine-dependent methyltransferase [Rhizopus microsporus]